MQSGSIPTLSHFVRSINYPITSHIVYEASSADVLNTTETSILQKEYLSYAKGPEGKF